MTIAFRFIQHCSPTTAKIVPVGVQHASPHSRLKIMPDTPGNERILPMLTCSSWPASGHPQGTWFTRTL